MSTNSRIAFGVNAAQGLSLQVARTWSETLVRDPRLMVPVHLDVLMVRSEGGTWARTGLFQNDAQQWQQPAPFEDLPQPRAKGAYLMWSPPDALARGRQAEGDTQGPLRFAGLPDRWLVLRLAPSVRAAGRRTVRGWVLRADQPELPPVPLDQYKESDLPADGQLSPPVTVMGPGQLNWAGYFDNAQGVMAFHDPLSDVKQGTVSYLVCGWYHDPDNDPLADPDLRSLKDFKARLADYRWSLPDAQLREAQAHATRHSETLSRMGLNVRASTKATRRMASPMDAATGAASRVDAATGLKLSVAAWWPRHSLYHGAVVGLGWPTAKLGGSKRSLLDAQGHEVGGPPAASSVKVGLGQTLSEAMAAMVARRQGKPAMERLFQAFQLGAINELDEPDGRARVDALLHATTFASAPGGSSTERVWQPPLGEPDRDGVVKQPGKGVFDRYYHGDVKGASRQTANIGSQAGRGAKAVSEQGRAYKVEAAAPRAQFETLSFKGKALQAEERIYQGGISTALKNLGLGSGKTPYRPGRWVDRDRPLPRLYTPQAPVIVIEGIKRPYQHGGDGRFSQDGLLGCRLTGSWVKAYRSLTLNRSFNAEDVLDRSVMNGSVPPECEHLLNEMVLLCPGSAEPFVSVAAKAGTSGKRALTTTDKAAEAQRVMVHQTSWWGARDPRVDSSALVSLSPYTGTLPSSVAFAPPARPWNPLHLDWRIEFTPSPKGMDDWAFGECDFNELAPKVPPAGSGAPLVIEGRSYLAAGAGKAMASAIRQTLADALRIGDSGTLDVEAVHAYASDIGREVSRFISGITPQAADEGLNAAERAALGDIASALEQMDVLTTGFEGVHQALRQAEQLQVLRAGFMRIVRLRVVDGFGQVLDLAGSSATKAAQPDLLGRSTAMEVTGRQELMALPPRFTAPARLLLRFMDAQGGPDEARSATDKDAEVTPICGYLMPNHLDDALLFFNPDGQDVGVVRRDEDDRIVWEDAPGAPSHVGASPAQAIANPFLADLAQGLLDWGVADAGLNALPNDTALRALMRVIDTTRWSTDPFGHQGEEHLALLVGHPVVVVRAVLRLEVQEGMDEDKANEQVIPVRLGSLSQWQDGLLGYFVQDDFRKLRCSEGAVGDLARAFGQQEGFLQAVDEVPAYADGLNQPEALQPITHHYVDRSGILYVRPNQDVNLVLLVEPHTLVHATCGVLPRKEAGLKKEWTQDALAKLSPTFRFGPVLIDPKQVRMPVAAELNGTWSWDHRTDVTTWENLPVTHIGQEALFPQDPPVASEGWLRLRPHEDDAQAASQQGGQP